MIETECVTIWQFGHQLLPSNKGLFVVRFDPNTKQATIGRSKQSVNGGDTEEKPLPLEIFEEFRRRGFLQEAYTGIGENRENVHTLNEDGRRYFRSHDENGNRISVRANNDTAIRSRGLPVAGHLHTASRPSESRTSRARTPKWKKK